MEPEGGGGPRGLDFCSGVGLEQVWPGKRLEALSSVMSVGCGRWFGRIDHERGIEAGSARPGPKCLGRPSGGWKTGLESAPLAVVCGLGQFDMVVMRAAITRLTAG